MMKGFSTFTVLPKMPENLAFLQTLANNVWWAENTDAVALFKRVNAALFTELEANPVKLLAKVGQARLEELAKDVSFLAHLRSVQTEFEAEVQTSRNWKKPGEPYTCIAYFSMEFGLHESVHIYSGGLGILAGDHLKSSSDLDLPLCGIGLLYKEGYFEQAINVSGYQTESYPTNDLHTMPISRVCDKRGTPLVVSVPLPEGTLCAAVWRLDVGRIPLFLLDTDIPENPEEFMHITGRLYGGDRKNRLRQEILLGLGGLRALDAMGYEVAVSHMNEGHAAFLGIERISKAMAKGLSYDEAREFVRRTSVFTTHTPVPAGNETFEMGLLQPHLEAIEKEGGLAVSVVKPLGCAPGDDCTKEFSMTILGLNCSAFNNGVAQLHGVVERHMWHHLWPDTPVEEVPIGHITNGVHASTWVATETNALYASVLGIDWSKNLLTEEQVERIGHIPDEELWRVHESNRASLIRFARKHIEACCAVNNLPYDILMQTRNILSKDILTIGFARRFATYKRATLLLSDMARLRQILTDKNRPVQVMFAGKAHPADEEGKAFIKAITDMAKEPDFIGKIIFLDNYNINIARMLVRGVDVWLNTPRRPNEASGTSGMKACINGAIHVSTLDGWWPEGYSPDCGWAIGNGDESADYARLDYLEAQSLYDLLDTEIIPMFYDRPHNELPHRWIAMMKASIKMGLTKFTSARMVTDYLNTAYTPSFESYDKLSKNGFKVVREEVAKREFVISRWGAVTVSPPMLDKDISKSYVGDEFEVSTDVFLGDIDPDDVSVEVYGGTPEHDYIKDPAIDTLELVKPLGDGRYLFKKKMKCRCAGIFSFSVRVVPKGDVWKGLIPGCIKWAGTGK